MPRAEISSIIELLIAFNIQTISSDTTTVGIIIDTAKYDRGVSFGIFSGTLTTGTYTPVVEEGDAANLSDAAAVADTDLYRKGVSSGQEADAAFAATDDNEIHKLAYIGKKRYVRLSIVSASTAAGDIGAFVFADPELQDVGDA